MNGPLPRPLPPMPGTVPSTGQQGPGAHADVAGTPNDGRHHHVPQHQQGTYETSPSWTQQHQYPFANAIPSGWTASVPYHHPHSVQTAMPDPLALMTFQSDAALAPAVNHGIQHDAAASRPRPPLPLPPTQGRYASSGNLFTAPTPAAFGRPHSMSFNAYDTHSDFELTAGLPRGWSVQPAAHVPGHGPPLPAPPSFLADQREDAMVASPTIEHAYSVGRSNVSSSQVTPSPPPASSNTHSTSLPQAPDVGPVQSLAQQLAASQLHDASIDTAEIAPYPSHWTMNGREQQPRPQASGNAIQDLEQRTGLSNPALWPWTSDASARSSFDLDGRSSLQDARHERAQSTFVPAGWSVLSSRSSQGEGQLAVPRPSGSSSSTTSLSASTAGVPKAFEEDDSISVLSLGSRRAAFSRDLADPEFLASMSIIARDVPLRDHAKGSLIYPDSFTGKDLISTLQEVVPAELFVNSHETTPQEQLAQYARLAALQVAEALRDQNLFHEVECDQGEVADSDDALYAFSDETLMRLAPVSARPRPLPSPLPSDRPGVEAEGPADDRTNDNDSQTSATGRSQHGLQRSKTLQWSDTVTPELRSKLGKWEVQRQNATLETIEKEEQFLGDLELLQELFVKGLREKSVIAADELDDFVRVVFGNHRQLASHIRALVEELHVRQAEQWPVVREIGDLFLNAALGWAEEYCSAITNYPFAANRVQKEEAKNPTFRAFLEDCLRDPRAQRLSLTTFLYRPVVRLQRYHLHFKAIMDVIKKSNDAAESNGRIREQASREYEALATVSGIIHTQVENAQRDLATSQYKVDIANFAEAFTATSKKSEFDVDMDLLNPERQLKHRGVVFLDGVKMHAILFDNYFVLAKEPKTVGDQPAATQRLVLAKRPIPVELLETSGFTSQSVSTSLALKFMHLGSSSRKVSRQVWPFTVAHSHNRIEPFTLTVSQEAARREWKSKFDEACAMRKIVQDAVKAWTVSTINDEVWGVHPSAGSGSEYSRDPTNKGTISCCSPFKVMLEGYQRPCVAMGTDQGVFIGPRYSSAIQKVLNLRNVTQIAIMDPLELMFVLADKVLWACRLADLFMRQQNLTGVGGGSPTLQQVSTREEEVLFFNVGILDSVRVVVYSKKKAYDRGTAFVILETNLDQGWTVRNAFGGRGGIQFQAFGNGRFEFPADVYSVQFRRKGLSLCTAKGFELCNLGRNESPAFLPVPAPPKKDDLRGQALLKRMKAAKPMNLFKLSDTEFLLCYNTFGCFVNADRTIARDGAVLEWETEPTSFVFRNPYLIAVDPCFVEIRIFNTVGGLTSGQGVSALSGRLLQFFRGEQMRLLNSQANDSVDLMPSFDPRRRLSNGPGSLMGQRDPDQDAIVLGALKRPKSGSARGAQSFQAVVEVVPLQYSNSSASAPR